MKIYLLAIIFIVSCTNGYAQIRIPFLEKPPVIDGNIDDWREYAFNDGVWDIYRVRNSDWYDGRRNRLTDHDNEPSPGEDLSARYFMAWDSAYLYLAAEVRDNVNDVHDNVHKPERWYYKDCICWFIEAPADTISESFAEGDNAFCFIADSAMPAYSVWWRHGSADKQYVEEPLPKHSYVFALRMDTVDTGNYIIEAKINMAQTLGMSDPSWKRPRTGDVYKIEIVHTDPDGGDYGAHLIIYGKGDNDRTWKEMILSPPQVPVQRNKN